MSDRYNVCDLMNGSKKIILPNLVRRDHKKLSMNIKTSKWPRETKTVTLKYSVSSVLWIS